MNRLLMFLTLVFAAGCADSDPVLEVSDAWIREAPPGMPMSAGFLKLTNNGTEAAVMVGATSESHDLVEIHVTRLEDGVARMRQLDSITVGAGETAVFEPGGRHLMLMKPRGPLKAGDEVRMQLQLRSGETVPVEFIVRKR